MASSSFPGRHPSTRPRRLRSSDWIRRTISETRLSSDDLVQAMILREDDAPAGPVPAMPGIFRLSVGEAVGLAKEAAALGVPALAMFPYSGPADRSADAKAALDPHNLMCRTAQAIKKEVPGIGLIADVALDPYTEHGHDGILRDGEILNDETVEMLVRQAIVLGDAGFDVLAPSDMMDGRIGAIRAGLDGAGLSDKLILSYAVKYASRFYGPYRDAIGSRGVLQGDKRTYQMDPANAQEGLKEVELDLAEGADMVMVKPGLPYLDMIARVKTAFAAPTLAFQVSGEYAMLANAAEAGAFDFKEAGLEALMCFRRAGADAIISYYATRAAGWLAESQASVQSA